MKGSTFKYDEDAPMYRLDFYSAYARIGEATNPATLGEATALYELLSAIGVTPEGAMEGSYLEATTVDCRIDAHLQFDKPQRFLCDLALPF